MWEMAKSSIVLFLQGRLFKDPGKVMAQVGLGVVVTAVLLIILARNGVPIWAAAAVAGFLGGMLQPYLFKDLKYR